MLARRVVSLVALALTAAACSAGALSPDDPAANSGAPAENGAAHTESLVAPSCMVPVDPSKSLFVTDPTVLERFSFERVMQQLLTSSGATGAPLALFQQWWDTNNRATPTTRIRPGSHCDDDGGTVNGFPIECPRQEGALAHRNPFVAGADHFSPVAVVNRFDLAPRNGANCGEYRVVFAKDSGLTNGSDRVLVIFEAVLPNPSPALGIDGCVDVARFWDGLSSTSGTDAGGALAGPIDSFFFTGLPGFEPVIRFDHYGANGAGTGQIRANQFMASTGGQQWELRQYGLHRVTGSSELVVTLDAVGNNPDPSLVAGQDERSVRFRSAFLAQVPSLAARDPNLIAMTTLPAFNGGQSREQSESTDNYENAGASADFLSRIAARIPAGLGEGDGGASDPITPADILARATTQSCQGCHEGEVGRPLGAHVTWPESNGFTQIDEHSRKSQALTGTFLPFRKKVLETFLTAECQPHTASAGDGTLTVSGNAVGAAN